MAEPESEDWRWRVFLNLLTAKMTRMTTSTSRTTDRIVPRTTVSHGKADRSSDIIYYEDYKKYGHGDAKEGRDDDSVTIINSSNIDITLVMGVIITAETIK